ncbi:hypothetical protein [Algoriphagus boritolerans]|uniref:Small multi-drug export protein n=1 Tax=Algoriphagus boritolerans DSM 17298 = JCM 18970 TaxID=1120964 RepID=A0A1H5SYB9_9BACT|nr:hypothetical protein [Algoriphagus boritolerans]SEF54938.1 hypothetical protein SAMN03080598_00559 [Algoriphagus boritolerans DSM 17298 = JCM 18970]
MSESLITFFSIYFLCLFKFIAGPVLGAAAGYGFWLTMLVTVSGMMSSVFFFTFVGEKIKKTLALRFNRKRTVFSRKSRAIVTLWKKYGEIGIAFATPLFLTPIGGTLILVSFGTKKQKIFFYMFWSAIIWSSIFSLSIEQILRIPFFDRLLG